MEERKRIILGALCVLVLAGCVSFKAPYKDFPESAKQNVDPALVKKVADALEIEAPGNADFMWTPVFFTTRNLQPAENEAAPGGVTCRKRSWWGPLGIPVLYGRTAQYTYTREGELVSRQYRRRCLAGIGRSSFRKWTRTEQGAAEVDYADYFLIAYRWVIERSSRHSAVEHEVLVPLPVFSFRRDSIGDLGEEILIRRLSALSGLVTMSETRTGESVTRGIRLLWVLEDRDVAEKENVSIKAGE